MLNKFLILTAISLCPVFALANQIKAIPFEHCFNGAASRFSVNKVILMAIAKTESGFNAQALNTSNADGSVDVGIMQINSFWFPSLKKIGIQEADLRNGCTNIYVGAWILSQNIKSHGNTWKAVGAYNARSPLKQVTYVNKVMLANADINKNYYVR